MNYPPAKTVSPKPLAVEPVTVPSPPKSPVVSEKAHWPIAAAVGLVGLFGMAVPAIVVAIASSIGGSQVAAVEPPPTPLVVADVVHGRDLYASSCVACHGADAHGVPNLGKDLTTGFAKATKDAALVAMITKGRNPGEPGHTSAVPMPPKGGHAEFSATDIGNIVSYLRSLQDPSRLTEPLPTIVQAPAPVEAPAPVAAAQPPVSGASNVSASVSASAFDAEAAARGKRVYLSCMACHGKAGTGMPNMGADLVHSEFIHRKTDAELVAFIAKGRLPTDPETRLKLTMPPKGGNPSLKENQLADVVAYLRSLQAAAAQTK